MTIVMFILHKPVKVHVKLLCLGFKAPSLYAHDMMGKTQDLG